MSKVLYIKANANEEVKSRTYKISESFLEEYKKNNPDDDIITLDLYKEGINFLPQDKLSEVHAPRFGEGKDHPILKYAYQFAEADKYIVAAPLWNLSIPAILKAYIDYICVTGITFKYTENGPVGLCKGKKAVHIVARGGGYLDFPFSELEMGDRYLRTIFGFMGITNFVTITAEHLDVIGSDVNGIVDNVVLDAQKYAKKF
ncbi:MAG: Acyl carrier protein phosphodiesterase [Clostridiales bacterium]|jgi:FMN-dependent NADH-azoreductase|nr:Acyl carrier protein phosphodiesterase [Clostridiales bacterium]